MGPLGHDNGRIRRGCTRIEFDASDKAARSTWRAAAGRFCGIDYDSGRSDVRGHSLEDGKSFAVILARLIARRLSDRTTKCRSSR